MANKVITHEQVDEVLSRISGDLDGYEDAVDGYVQELGERDLEISAPTERRKDRDHAGVRAYGSIEEQFRAEVDRIELHDRATEAKLARRIEFARRRLELALEAQGLSFEDLKGCAQPVPCDGTGSGKFCCKFPGNICRRWAELHALRTEMVERNLYLAMINVERYSHTRVDRMDLIQEGSSALFRAVDGFDWRRGLLFRTYAVHWLNQAFRSYLYNFGSTVRVPVYLQKAMKHVNGAVERLGDPKASVEEIASEADLGERLVASALGASRITQSIDVGSGRDEDGPGLREMLSGEDGEDPYDPSMEEFSVQDGIEMALDRLSARERMVISKRFGIEGEREHTLAEVAQELGVSLERVRQIQVRSMSKMKTPKLRRAIDPFLVA